MGPLMEVDPLQDLFAVALSGLFLFGLALYGIARGHRVTTRTCGALVTFYASWATFAALDRSVSPQGWMWIAFVWLVGAHLLVKECGAPEEIYTRSTQTKPVSNILTWRRSDPDRPGNLVAQNIAANAKRSELVGKHLRVADASTPAGRDDIFQVTFDYGTSHEVMLLFAWDTLNAEQLSTLINSVLQRDPSTWSAWWSGRTNEADNQRPAIAGPGWKHVPAQ